MENYKEQELTQVDILGTFAISALFSQLHQDQVLYPLQNKCQL